MKTRWLVLVMAAALGGCGPFKMPSFPKGVRTPEAAITAVRLIDTGEQASRFDVDVTLSNPNDVPLPLTHATYELEITGVAYASDVLPNTTLPALGEITVTLPAVLETDVAPPAGGEYTARGRIELTPGGQVRKLFYDMGIPKPKARFRGEGVVTAQPQIPKDEIEE